MRSLLAAALSVGLAAAAWPNGPFTTSDTSMLDASGNVVKYAGANWPGAADVMIPEGLQFQSVASIVAKLLETGVNTVRLTYAIELVDQIYDNGGTDIPVATAFVNALGEANGTAVFQQVLAANPTFSPEITRLEVFDAIAAECAANELYIHLDNHMSQGAWCCNTADKNGWWGEEFFPIANWTRGIVYMAEHVKSWPALTSVALRNEPRNPSTNPDLAAATYNWQSWYTYVQAGAAAIHAANPDPLIFLPGLDFDTYLTPVVRGTALTPGTGTFAFADFPAGKMVLELHSYANDAGSCESLTASLLGNGFEAGVEGAAAGVVVNRFPVLMTEWGFAMDDDTTWLRPYTQCLAEWLPGNSAGWMIWVLAGSYYVRSGTQDYDETWGLLTHDWSEWRNPEFVRESFIPMVNATLS